MKQRIIPAIMSGGAGTRLWPLSTDEAPKQFHAMTGDRTLFAETASRVRGEHEGLSFLDPIVLCNARHGEAVQDALQEAGVLPAAVILEPEARNTAAVAAVAAAAAAEIDSDAFVLLLPADHLVADAPAFHAALTRGAQAAADHIVTLGITPDRPATGYGYIKRGAEIANGVFAVEAFKEKPDEATAREYLAEGGFCWNSGMFLSHPRVMLEAFESSRKIRDKALEALAKARRNGREIVLAGVFAEAPKEPFDVAVMEKTKHAAVVPCEIGWADIGSWDEIWRLSAKDASGNSIKGRVAAVESENNLLRAEGVKLCVAGVQNLIVIATKEGVIVLPRDKAQDVKTLKELAARL